MPVGAFARRAAPSRPIGLFIRQDRPELLEAIAITLFDAALVFAAAVTRIYERGLVILEFLTLLLRKLFPRPVVGGREFLIEFAKPRLAADRLFVGVAGVPAIETLAGRR